eukprot:scaffold12876_cov52-Attheya_sp.AAC.1
MMSTAVPVVGASFSSGRDLFVIYEKWLLKASLEPTVLALKTGGMIFGHAYGSLKKTRDSHVTRHERGFKTELGGRDYGLSTSTGSLYSSK